MRTKVSHYSVEEELGAGGMGVVYKARDQRLGRAVALKFLPQGLAGNADARSRFIDEAKAASALDHPNICTIFDVEETSDGELFIAMAYYAGSTLSALIAERVFSLNQAIDVAMQIGKGLAAAHEALIIHRDIKPSNIIVSDRGTAKILDFGLAKLAGSADTSSPNVAAGTPAYMSPEQLRGEAVDRRTDVWSLGVVVFEMLTGQLPFGGEGAASAIRSILSDAPRLATELRPDLPQDIDTVLARALEKSPRNRYQSIEQFLAELQRLSQKYDSGALPIVRIAVRTSPSVAVLPFSDLSPLADQGYFCDGIAEEILRALSGLRGLYVASRTSSFQFRGAAVDVREIGERLNVGTIVEGSVRKAGDRVRVTAQLVNVADGYRLWSDRYDREMQDVFAIQDDIAMRVAEALQLTLLETERPTVRMATRDVDAFDAYLKGRKFFHLHRRKSYEVARQLFARAIEIDPSYARAWAGVANCCSFLHRFFGRGAEMVAEAAMASLRALELDPNLAEARAARGLALSLSKRFDEAEHELLEAIRLDRELFDGYYFLGGIYLEQGRLVDAASQFARACAITPEEYFCWFFLGMAYHGIGDEEKANTAVREGLQQARFRLATHPDDTRALTMAAGALAEVGEPDRAVTWLQRALAIDPDEPIILYNAACAYVALGRHEDALDALERAVGPSHCLSVDWIANDPDLTPLAGYARFQQLLAAKENAAGI